MHAAHGGETSFNIVIEELSTKDDREYVYLDAALCCEDCTAPPEPSNNEERSLGGDYVEAEVADEVHLRRGMLLAEAASGGDTRVLKRVVRAIQVMNAS